MPLCISSSMDAVIFNKFSSLLLIKSGLLPHMFKNFVEIKGNCKFEGLRKERGVFCMIRMITPSVVFFSCYCLLNGNSF